VQDGQDRRDRRNDARPRRRTRVIGKIRGQAPGPRGRRSI
ncbi:uncharacterized protein METZ01_LOCUS286893, partial [marine metagenome]